MTLVIDSLAPDTTEHWADHSPRLPLKDAVRDLERPYVAVLGGSETYGKHIDVPFPALLEEWTGMPVVNLGVLHAGVSLFNTERWLLDIASGAELTVLQITGAQNMTNRLYHVHPRRNDRFLASSKALTALYPSVDFAEINFTGHLLSTLRGASPEGFQKVVDELRFAWVQRMRRVIKAITGDVCLLWMSERRPEDPDDQEGSAEPMFVTRDMLDDLAPFVVGLTEVVRPGTADLVAAGALHHAAVAEALASHVAELSDGQEKGPEQLSEPSRLGFCGVQSFSSNSGTAVNRSATRP